MQHFDEQTIRDLEFDVLRARLHDACVQPSARLRMISLAPLKDFNALKSELDRTAEFTRMRSEGIVFPAIDFEELNSEIHLLKVRDSVLGEDSFSRIFKASTLVNEIIAAFYGMEEALPALYILLCEVYPTHEINSSISNVFDSKWKVKDDASPELQQIRFDMSNVRKQIARNFSKVMRDFKGKGFLGDTGEAFINERKVLAVYSAHKRKVPGIAVGSSKTGVLTDIEPEINIPLNFELEALFDDERREIRKILQRLTALVRHHLPLIIAYHELLIELDFIQAKSRLALELDATVPELSDEPLIDLKKAYHPILLLNNRKLGKRTFPQTLLMDKFSRMLVISGPNAGGKSITMKTIGLLQVMLQSGLLIPVARGSRMSFFQSVLTDIGDNQSIENQLSTYSYRLRRMKHFLDVANRRSLLLLDEFGTGSDPDLGGALAEVFFEELYNRKSFGVITTHYGNIKLKAAQLKNAMNGCMLFNLKTLEPSYQLSLGQPGSSFTFEVAQINGIPTKLIVEAKSKLNSQKVQMDEMLSSLQEERSHLEMLSRSAKEAAELASNTIVDFEKKKERYEDKLEKQAQTIERNNKFLHHGKRMAAFIDAYKPKAKNKELLEEIKKYIVLEKSKIDDERRKRNIEKNIRSGKEEKNTRDQQIEKIKTGSLVKLENTKQTGKVLEINNGEAVVAFGVFKTKVEVERLIFIQ
ncbi:MAG: DNA mismatch repair protein MutS [Crocinitomicaceae bacterium]|nr:DNA mismatch repair protein MutS [Crocinitomicaceae bacterium]